MGERKFAHNTGKRRVAIVAGGRTPFVKAGKAFKDLGPLKLACHAVRGLIERHDVDANGIQAVTYGDCVKFVIPSALGQDRPDRTNRLADLLSAFRRWYAKCQEQLGLSHLEDHHGGAAK